MAPPLQGDTVEEVEASWQRLLRVIETVFRPLSKAPGVENLKAEWIQLKLHWVAASPACIAATGEEKSARIQEHIWHIGKQLELALAKVHDAREEWQDSPSAPYVRNQCRLLEVISMCQKNGISAQHEVLPETEELDWLKSYKAAFPNVVKELRELRNTWKNPRHQLTTQQTESGKRETGPEEEKNVDELKQNLEAADVEMHKEK
ncbi:hypothetical protein N0V85_009604 [Neurospora sp. IMI 360204]|nr:hypothetical protein N0V85_009604 [Neurospora sp. IMI 360204]